MKGVAVRRKRARVSPHGLLLHTLSEVDVSVYVLCVHVCMRLRDLLPRPRTPTNAGLTESLSLSPSLSPTPTHTTVGTTTAELHVQ